MVDVHRLKCLDIKPSAILCIAYNAIKRSPKLAVSRSDGSIEIWDVISECKASHVATIPGRTDVSVERVIWYKQRLLSAGLSGTINEWDTHSLRCIRSVDAMGSPIWCVGVHNAHKRLAAGTDNGKICIYDLGRSNIQYMKTLDNLNSRVLSLCWHSNGQSMVTGCSNGTVRVIDVDSGRSTMRITLDKMADSTDALIWDILYLSDYTIVTASSSGKVQFWNGRFGTLRHSYHSHIADVSTLVVDTSECGVYAAGVDSKVVQFKRVNDSGSWIQCTGVRVHIHNVKSLALTAADCLVSGGIDGQLCLYDTGRFDRTNTVTYSPFTAWTDRFKYITSSNTLMYQTNTSLKFWRITTKHGQVRDSTVSSSCSPDKDGPQSSAPSRAVITDSDLLSLSGLPVNFLEIRIPSVDHILSSSLSEDGTIVMMSCVDNTWVYQITDNHVKCIGNDISVIDASTSAQTTQINVRHKRKFKDALFIAPLEHNELLVVEKPWNDRLPPCLKRKRYGDI